MIKLITPQPETQKGIALITVLFMFALATIILSGLFILQETNMQRSSSILESEQAYLLCLSGEEWARQLLAEDYKLNPDIDHVHEKWAEDGKILELDNGYIEISIHDAQGKFNLNNLDNSTGVTNPIAKMAFQRMIYAALQDQQLSETLANEAADWLDSDNNGIEESDYLSEPIPYRPPNSAITDISELRWLKDMDQKTYKILYQEVFPSLIALPKQAQANQTPININTASPLVLAALSGLSVEQTANMAKTIQSSEEGNTLPAALALFPQLASSQSGLSANTAYFEVKIRAKFADHYAFLTSIIFRDPQKGDMKIISRDRSERFIFTFSKDYNAKDTSEDFGINI